MLSATRKMNPNSGTEASAPGKSKTWLKKIAERPMVAAKESTFTARMSSGATSERSNITSITKITPRTRGTMVRRSWAAVSWVSSRSAAAPPTSAPSSIWCTAVRTSPATTVAAWLSEAASVAADLDAAIDHHGSAVVVGRQIGLLDAIDGPDRLEHLLGAALGGNDGERVDLTGVEVLGEHLLPG